MKDRGLIKWTPSFLLPEQIKMYNQIELDDTKVEKPILDEYELQTINDLLMLSILEQEPIQLKLWLDGFIEYIQPFITTKINPYERKLFGIHNNSNHSFSFDSIIGISRI